jgi:hypothetical protein
MSFNSNFTIPFNCCFNFIRFPSFLQTVVTFQGYEVDLITYHIQPSSPMGAISHFCDNNCDGCPHVVGRSSRPAHHNLPTNARLQPVTYVTQFLILQLQNMCQPFHTELFVRSVSKLLRLPEGFPSIAFSLTVSRDQTRSYSAVRTITTNLYKCIYVVRERSFSRCRPHSGGLSTKPFCRGAEHLQDYRQNDV